MRILNLLLAVYILVLSVSPCTDDHHRHEQPDGSQVTVVPAQDHAAGAHDCDGITCSPFCLCHCLGGFVPLTHTFPDIHPAITLLPAQALSMPAIDQPREYAVSLWQPPTQA